MELVRLVHDDEIHIRTLATRDRLDGANLDGLLAIGSLVDSLHDADAADALGLESGDSLVDQAEVPEQRRRRASPCRGRVE